MKKITLETLRPINRPAVTGLLGSGEGGGSGGEEEGDRPPSKRPCERATRLSVSLSVEPSQAKCYFLSLSLALTDSPVKRWLGPRDVFACKHASLGPPH